MIIINSNNCILFFVKINVLTNDYHKNSIKLNIHLQYVKRI